MPEYYNNILAVRYQELIPEFFSTENYLRKKISVHKKRGYGIKVLRRGGAGYKALLEFDSLPPSIKEALGDPRKTGHVLEQFYETDSKAVTFYQEHQFKDMSYIADDIQQKYITNASVLKAVALLKSAREHEIITKGFSARGIFNSLTSDALSFNSVLNKKYGVQHNLPANPIRFKQKFIEFKAKGYLSLISKYHKNSNGQKVTEHTVKFLNDLFAGVESKPNATEIARQYETFLGGYLEVFSKETGELYTPESYPKLSKGTITSYLAQWDNVIGTHGKRNTGNRQVLMQKYSTYHSLSDPKFAGELISIDDRQPPFKYSENKRVWFYMGIDLGADAWTVWVHGTTKQGLIVDFYRQLVRNYHEWGFSLPAELEAESSLNSSFKKTFLQEGRMFDTVRIEANKARAKKVERKFGKVRYEYERHLEGFIPRPGALSEANQAGQVEISKIKKIPYNQIVENSLKMMEIWNNQLHDNQELHKGMTRWEVFCEKQHPDLKPTNYRSILPYLGYKTETSCHVGIIKLQGSEWLLGDKNEIYTGENLLHLMRRVEGQKIDIYWLDGNNGSIIKALVYIKDQFICEALQKPVYSRSKIGRTADDEAQREIMSKYANTIDSYMRTQKNKIERVHVADHSAKVVNNKFKINRAFDPKDLSPEKSFIEQPVEILDELEDEFDMAEYQESGNTQFDRF